MNPGGERFYRKLSDRALNQVLLHEISKCVWDAEEMSVTLPNAQSELSAVMEFKNQDWVKNIAQADQHNQKRSTWTQMRHSHSRMIFQLELST
jgi:hypothetical protein